jgi:hypothetical protein
MNQRQFNDLAKLAIERCRASTMTVVQLLDNDKERAALLMSVATDMIEGAACLVENIDDEHEITADEALGTVLAMILRSLGIDRVMKAISSDPQFKAVLPLGYREEAK